MQGSHVQQKQPVHAALVLCKPNMLTYGAETDERLAFLMHKSEMVGVVSDNDTHQLGKKG